MLINKSKINFYKEHGYLILRNCLDKKKILTLQENVEKLLSREFKNLDITIKKNNIIQKGFPLLKKKYPMVNSKIYRSINRSYFFSKFIFHQQISQLAKKILEVKRTEFLGCISPTYRIDVPGDKKNIRNWHQESNYFKDVAHGHEATVCWIPLNKSHAKNGSVIIAPGTHSYGNIKANEINAKALKSQQFILPKNVLKNSKKKISIDTNIGDMAFINFDLFHSSGKNQSSSVRNTAQIRFIRNDVLSYNPPMMAELYD